MTGENFQPPADGRGRFHGKKKRGRIIVSFIATVILGILMAHFVVQDLPRILQILSWGRGATEPAAAEASETIFSNQLSELLEEKLFLILLR